MIVRLISIMKCEWPSYSTIAWGLLICLCLPPNIVCRIGVRCWICLCLSESTSAGLSLKTHYFPLSSIFCGRERIVILIIKIILCIEIILWPLFWHATPDWRAVRILLLTIQPLAYKLLIQRLHGNTVAIRWDQVSCDSCEGGSQRGVLCERIYAQLSARHVLGCFIVLYFNMLLGTFLSCGLIDAFVLLII